MVVVVVPLVYEPHIIRLSGSYRNSFSKSWRCSVPDAVLLPEIGFAVVRDGRHDISTVSRRIKVQVKRCKDHGENVARTDLRADPVALLALMLLHRRQRNDSFAVDASYWKEGTASDFKACRSDLHDQLLESISACCGRAASDAATRATLIFIMQHGRSGRANL